MYGGADGGYFKGPFPTLSGIKFICKVISLKQQFLGLIVGNQ